MSSGKLVRCSVDRSIAISRRDLPEAVEQLLMESLTFRNPAREAAEREGKFGWKDMDEWLELFGENEDTLYVPRGFKGDLERGLKAFGLEPHYNYQVTDLPGHHEEWHEVEKLRMGQDTAIQKLLDTEQGIIAAPPGWGKTVMLLEAIRRSGQKALVIVDKSAYMNQWIDRAKTYFGAECGRIGRGSWDEKPLTIAMQQTLWSRRDQLINEHWFERWGLVALDECHHASADTYTKILGRFNARYRWGLSATPDREDGYTRVTETVLGDVLFKPDKAALRAAGQLIKPSVLRIPSPFTYPYKPTRRVGSRVIPNNYTKMVNHLGRDKGRNWIIAEHCFRGHAHLVVSDRLFQLDDIAGQCKLQGWPSERLLFLTGRESDPDKRAAVIAEAERGDCVLFSTIAKEALDIPRLEGLHLAWPVRKEFMMIQLVGRIERGHPDKKSAVVFDYFDPKVKVLRSQSSDRAKFYDKEGFKIESDF